MKKILSILFVSLMIFGIFTISVSAEDNSYKFNGSVIGTLDSDGKIILNKDSIWAINDLLSGNKKRTIVLPKTTIHLGSMIWMGSNKTIIAKGATIIQDSLIPIAANASSKLNYNSMKNVTIEGGKWLIKGLTKSTHSTSNFRFAHAQNIKFKNVYIETNYFSHAVELIACKNVTFDKCKLIAKGKKNTKGIDEVLQIDVASSKTAPSEKSYGSKFVKGQVCKNITVKNCTVKGGRGICTNKTDSDGNKWISGHHTNIKILNNTIYGYTHEALCLHNAAGVTVKGNKIYSKGSNNNYNIGCYLLSAGKFKKLSKYKNVFANNTIKGGRNGLYISSDNGTKFGKITVKNNKLYAKAGKQAALAYNYCPKISISNNKLYKW